MKSFQTEIHRKVGMPRDSQNKTGRTAPFWKRKSLDHMTSGEWEALCDGCGRCCLQKFKNEKTGKTYYTYVSCYLLDTQTCRCRSYRNRHYLVKGCQVLTPDTAVRFRWLPETCAYRLLARGIELPWWHPLVSGDPNTVHRAGMSVRGWAVLEDLIHPDDLEWFIMTNSDFPGSANTP